MFDFLFDNIYLKQSVVNGNITDKMNDTYVWSVCFHASGF